MAKKKTGGARRAAGSGTGGIRRRIHDLTLRAVRDHDLSLSEIPDLAREVVHGAGEALDKAMPKSARSVLRQVVGGLTDAMSAAAKATKVTAVAAGERGAAFLKNDLKRTGEDMQKLESAFFSSVQRAGKSLSGVAKSEIDTIVTEAKKAGAKIGPAAKGVVKAADGRVMELGREAADTGARVARDAVQTILHGAGGLLEGLADAVKEPKPVKKAAKKTVKRASAGKKMAKKGGKRK